MAWVSEDSMHYRAWGFESPIAVGEGRASSVSHQVKKGRSGALPPCFLPTYEWPAHTWPFICLQD